MSTNDASAVSMYPSLPVHSTSGSFILEVRPCSSSSPSHVDCFIAARMPNGTFFQSAYPFPSQTYATQPTQPTQPNSGSLLSNLNEQTDSKPNDATSALSEAIDDFLGDLERKFKTVSDEILTRLDDMAERCDRLEAELLMRDAAGAETSKSSLEEKSEG